MSAKEYIKEINKLNIRDRMLILKSLQESITKETGPESVDPVILDILIERQKNLKVGHASSRPWNDIKKDLLK